jgi:hypothetical protein
LFVNHTFICQVYDLIDGKRSLRSSPMVTEAAKKRGEIEPRNSFWHCHPYKFQGEEAENGRNHCHANKDTNLRKITAGEDIIVVQWSPSERPALQKELHSPLHKDHLYENFVFQRLVRLLYKTSNEDMRNMGNVADVFTKSITKYKLKYLIEGMFGCSNWIQFVTLRNQKYIQLCQIF